MKYFSQLLLIPLLGIVWGLAENRNKTLSGPTEKTCMRDLGCFEITEDFIDFKNRPLNLLPQPRQLINTQFFLYTRKNSVKEQILVANKKETLINSNLDISHKTIFIVHGFLDTQYFGQWLKIMKDEFLKNEDYNVIIVDWTGGNQLPYTQATANTRVVGVEMALLIAQLQRAIGIKPQLCHIVGHSLGAHAAGYTGKRIHGLGRITALDPAGPYFEGMPPSVRMDSTDADFVDVIHTDSDSILVLGLGMKQLVGHVDFFPNNGKDQPGCQTSHRLLTFITEGLIEGMRRVVSCSHQRAVDFFTSSINLNEETCMYVGFRCANWTHFQNGKCSDCGPEGKECSVMGLHADKYKPHPTEANVEYFLKTSGSAPFCVQHYLITVQLGEGKDEAIGGKVKFTFKDKSGKDFTITPKTEYDAFTPGRELNYLTGAPFELKSQKTVGFYWVSSSFNFFHTHKINIKNIKIIPMNFMKTTDRKEHTLTYYPTVKGPYKEIKTVYFNLE